MRRRRCRDPWSWPLAQGGCGVEDSGDDGRIACAPADVPGQHIAHLPLVGRGHLAQEMGYGAQYPRRAEPAMQGVMFRKGALHLVECACFGEPLHRDNIRVVGLSGVLGAAAHRAPVADYGAGATYAVLAADVNAESLKLVPEKVAQQHARLSVAGAGLAVQGQLNSKSFACGTMQRRHCRRSRRCRAIFIASPTARSTRTWVSAIR